MVQPTGVVTLVFTDIEGSTRLLQMLGGDRYADALEMHRQLLREAFQRHEGYEVGCEGDSLFVSFASAHAAVAAASEAQQALAEARWPEGATVRVRMGVHTGEPLSVPPKYVGIDVHRAARVMAAGHGGQVLVTRATRELLGESFELRDLGKHRLKDLAEPEWLFQLGQEDSPPLRSLNNTNVPLPASPLISRELEISEIRTLVNAGTRLLTLTGPGGTGKTRLALAVAADLIANFANGVFFVDLSPVQDPTSVPSVIAQTLGIRERAPQPILETIAHELGSAPTLLLLDNYEHVISSGPQVAELLARAPLLYVLATSREPLHVADEREFVVGPLTESASVELFQARAANAEPQETVLEICRRLDGLPLAIEIAAARTKVLPPSALLARLEPSLSVLEATRRDVPARHQTLRATISWSFDLLTVTERRVFSALSVFEGGCTLAAAQEVCGADLGIVESLVDKSLLRQQASVGSEPRVSMLQTIREFAREQLAAGGDKAAVRLRHAVYYANLVTSGEPGGSRDAVFDLAHSEYGNLVASLSELEAAGEIQRGLNLAGSMVRYWQIRGVLAEQRRWLETFAMDPRAEARERAIGLSQASYAAFQQRDFPAAQLLTEEALTLARSVSDRYAISHVLQATAIVAKGTGNIARARELLEESLRLAREVGKPITVAARLENLADVALLERNYEEAAMLAAQGLELIRGVGDHQGEVICTLNLAAATFYLGDLAEAAQLFGQAGSVAASLGYEVGLNWCLSGMAAVHASTGELERAAVILGGVEAAVRRGEIELEPAEQNLRDETLAHLRDALPPDAFRRAWQQGATMERSEHVRLAFQADYSGVT